MLAAGEPPGAVEEDLPVARHEDDAREAVLDDGLRHGLLDRGEGLDLGHRRGGAGEVVRVGLVDPDPEEEGVRRGAEGERPLLQALPLSLRDDDDLVSRGGVHAADLHRAGLLPDRGEAPGALRGGALRE